MTDIFIGRQPIFDRRMEVHAYELLFRSSDQTNAAGVIDGDSATSQVILNTFDLGLENLVGGHKAFINLTQTFISDPDLVVAPPDQIVLEVLEDIRPSPTIIDTLETLKERGHTIALDDFIYDSQFEPFLQLADIIKIDIMQLDDDQIQQYVERLKPYGMKLLAEKIETRAEFDFLEGLGFDYFQGYFFSKPSIVKGKTIAPNQITLLELISRVNNKDVDVNELSRIISTDISLSHKILKFINSPLNGLRSEVESIQQAVVLLGLNMVKNWITVLALATGSDKPSELARTALVRGKCCELIARQGQLQRPEMFFTVGLFSTLDAMMDQPLEVLLDDLPLTQDAREALLHRGGILGQALSATLAMEKADVSHIDMQNMDLSELADIYLQAVKWADELSTNF